MGLLAGNNVNTFAGSSGLQSSIKFSWLVKDLKGDLDVLKPVKAIVLLASFGYLKTIIFLKQLFL